MVLLHVVFDVVEAIVIEGDAFSAWYEVLHVTADG